MEDNKDDVKKVSFKRPSTTNSAQPSMQKSQNNNHYTAPQQPQQKNDDDSGCGWFIFLVAFLFGFFVISML